MIKSGDPDHAFPRGVDALEKAGNRFFQRGKDGAMYEHLQINGSYKGREGTFEYIKDPNGYIKHRFFRQK